MIPSVTDAGGNITHDWLLEIDPLSSDAIINQSKTEFIQDISPSMKFTAIK